MNEEPIKRTSKATMMLIIIIAITILLIPLIISLLGVIIIPKLMYRMEDKTGIPNYEIEGLTIYISRSWLDDGLYHISPKGNCKITGGVALYDQNQMETKLLGYELEHEKRTINNIDMSYGFKNNGKDKIYSYAFEDYSNKYFILFINSVDSDEECDTYLEKLEQSITLNPKGEEL